MFQGFFKRLTAVVPFRSPVAVPLREHTPTPVAAEPVVAEPSEPVVILKRLKSNDEGTLGTWVYPNEDYACKAIELPDRQNRSNISRIPEGDYLCVPYSSAKYKNVYHIQDVEGRFAVLTHKGNVAGDKEKGYRTHSWGCILLGLKFSRLWGQNAVVNSGTAFNEFATIMGKQNFLLKIRDENSSLPL